MPSTTHTIDQQIREVQEALKRLRSLKKFRGQKALIRDAEKHLAFLLEAGREQQSDQHPAVGAV